MLFYLRESSRSDQLARNEFEDDDVLHYYYDDKIASVGGNDYDDYYQLVFTTRNMSTYDLLSVTLKELVINL